MILYGKVLVPKLRAKPVRTASGIAVVAVMCKPHRYPNTQYSKEYTDLNSKMLFMKFLTPSYTTNNNS